MLQVIQHAAVVQGAALELAVARGLQSLSRVRAAKRGANLVDATLKLQRVAGEAGAIHGRIAGGQSANAEQVKVGLAIQQRADGGLANSLKVLQAIAVVRLHAFYIVLFGECWQKPARRHQVAVRVERDWHDAQ